MSEPTDSRENEATANNEEGDYEEDYDYEDGEEETEDGANDADEDDYEEEDPEDEMETSQGLDGLCWFQMLNLQMSKVLYEPVLHVRI